MQGRTGTATALDFNPVPLKYSVSEGVLVGQVTPNFM